MSEPTLTHRKYPYSRAEREDHNRVARALALGHCLSDVPHAPALDPVQPAADALSSEMYAEWQRDFKLCHDAIDALLRGRLEEAVTLAREEYAQRRRFSRAMQEYAQRTRGASGARGKGHTYFAVLEGMTFYFDCVLCWVDDGQRLEVVNSRELELNAGRDASSQAWAQLAAWVQAVDQNRRMMTADEDALIWMDNQNGSGSLRYRQTLEDKYPELHGALEVLSGTLRPYREETPSRKFELEALKLLDAGGLGNQGQPRARVRTPSRAAARPSG